jgi:para-aminobenzoate synthetase component 1
VPAADVSPLVAHLPLEGGVAVVRDGGRTVLAAGARETLVADGAAAFRALRRIERGGFWAGFLAYDLGRAVERVAPHARDELHLPDLAFARFDARLVVEPDGETRVEGSGPGRRLLEQARWRARRDLRGVRTDGRGRAPAGPPRATIAGAWHSSLTRRRHAAAVDAILELLTAGECYQVNLTRRLRARCTADPRALHSAVSRVNPAPHGALLAFGDARPGTSIVSASPELFLSVDDRVVTTRPIKGTARDADDLVGSAKDRAENVMIVDLARNDLGRVCVPGSIRVPSLCAVEAHPGLHHLVSTVRGTLDPGAGLDDLVRATFPPASVTGAPKPRVLQVIEDLEPVRRGAYCGALGWIDADRGRVELAVAIRTLVASGSALHLGVGGGIVADSRAGDEWDETELKAHRVLSALARAAPPVDGRRAHGDSG